MKKIEQIMKFIIRSAGLREKLLSVYDSYLIFSSGRRYRIALKKLKGKKKINVVFLATHTSTWKYDNLYKLFEGDCRFEAAIVVCPMIYRDDDYMHKEMEETFNFFHKKGFNVQKTLSDDTGEWLDIKISLKPDILFFTNPWYITRPEYLINFYLDYLTCYTPYGFYLSEMAKRGYSSFFHSVLWRNFLETDIHKDMYRESARRPENGVVTGSPGMDILIDPGYKPKDLWKDTGLKRKRVIWAPHHTITDEEGDLDFSTFFSYNEFMIDLAKRYHGQIQIAFKPHPLLKSKLYAEEIWGKEKTDLYYSHWDSLENGQLCETDYFDLFLTSDSLIFDSISFIAEYLYVNKPSLFLMSNRLIEKKLNEFGKKAIKRHYHAYDEEQIISFVENIIMEGNDLLSSDRKSFVKDYLCTRVPGTASEKIYGEILKTLLP